MFVVLVILPNVSVCRYGQPDITKQDQDWYLYQMTELYMFMMCPNDPRFDDNLTLIYAILDHNLRTILSLEFVTGSFRY